MATFILVWSLISYVVIGYVTKQKGSVTYSDVILWILSPIVLPIGIVIAIVEWNKDKKKAGNGIINAPEPWVNPWDK